MIKRFGNPSWLRVKASWRQIPSGVADLAWFEKGRIFSEWAAFSLARAMFMAIISMGVPGLVPVLAQSTYWEIDPVFAPVLESPIPMVSSPKLVAYPGGRLLAITTAAFVNGTRNRGSVVRLGANGDVDPGFVPIEAPPSFVVVYPDGRVLFGARDEVRQSTFYVRRVLADGTADPDFATLTVIGTSLSAVLLPDGRALLYGFFTRVGGVERHRLALLNGDGTLDATFTSPIANENTLSSVKVVVPSSDGSRFFVGGTQLQLGAGRNFFARLHLDGSVDGSFAVNESDVPWSPWAVYLESDGEMIVGGPDGALIRLGSDGTRDHAFAPFLQGNVQTWGPRDMAGRIYYTSRAGGFSDETWLRRLTPNGQDDPDFPVIETPYGRSYTVGVPVLGDDGALYLGPLTSHQKTARNEITRVGAEGAIDATYQPTFADQVTIFDYARLADGRHVVAGVFNDLGWEEEGSNHGIKRLLADGSVDETFSVSLSFGSFISGVVPQSGGGVLAVGSFSKGLEVPPEHVRRLTSDGDWDPTFAPISGLSGFLSKAVVDPSGRIYGMTQEDGRLRRFLPGGEPDLAFANPVLATDLAKVVPLYGGALLAAVPLHLGSDDVDIVRHLDSGARDSDFEPLRLRRLLALLALPDGSAVSVAAPPGRPGERNLEVSRIQPDGQIDLVFRGRSFSDNAADRDTTLAMVGAVLDEARSSRVDPVQPLFVRVVDGLTLGVAFNLSTEGELVVWTKRETAGVSLLEQFRRSDNSTPSYDPLPGVVRITGGPRVGVPVNAQFSLGVDASGRAPFSYQWFKSGELIEGATLRELKVDVASATAAGDYVVRITNAHGFVTSEPVFVSVDMQHAAPVILSGPVDRQATEGETVVFEVSAAAIPSPTYQWFQNDVAIPGATGSSLVISEAKNSDVGYYRVQVSNVVVNEGGTQTYHKLSSPASLVIDPLPSVELTGPARRVLEPGASLSLNVTAHGLGTLTYQWIHNGRPILGATSSSFTRATAMRKDSGWYAVRVSDERGTRTSAPMFVKVMPSITEVRGWGLDGQGMFNIPDELIDATEMTFNYFYGFALTRSGEVFEWGLDPWGADHAQILNGLSNVVRISGGGRYLAALLGDGTVTTRGTFHSPVPQPTALSNVAAISAAPTHVVALRTDGRVFAWGSNAYGETTVPADLRDVVAIKAGEGWSMALKASGELVTWGGGPGRLSFAPAMIEDGERLELGWNYLAALKRDGSLEDWGNFGSTVDSRPKPSMLTPLADLAVGRDHAIALGENGQLFAWGRNLYGQAEVPADLGFVLAVGAIDVRSFALRDATGDTVPVVISHPEGVAALEAERVTLSVAVESGLRVRYQWQKDGVDLQGKNGSQLTLANLTLANSGTYRVLVTNRLGTTTSHGAVVEVLPRPIVTSLSLNRQIKLPGEDLTLDVTATGAGALRYQWYHNGRPILGATLPTLRRFDLETDDSGWYVVEVTDDIGSGRSSAFFVTVAPEKTHLVTWGSTQYGLRNVPSELDDLVALDVGHEYALGLRRNGTVVSWGEGSASARAVPGELTEVVAVAAGMQASIALRADGTLSAWGATHIPAGLKNVVSIASYLDHFVAVHLDGKVTSWGGVHSAPDSLDRVVEAAVGYSFAIALRDDGTVSGWGTNTLGQSTPPEGLLDVVAVAATHDYAIALTKDGSVVRWGADPYQQPGVPPGLPAVRRIAAGAGHVVSLTTNGEVLAWGENDQGETLVPSPLSGGFFLAAGGRVSFVLCDATRLEFEAPTILEQPTSHRTTEGGVVSFSVVATGHPKPEYQWYRAGVPLNDLAWIEGSSTSTLTLLNVSEWLAGEVVVEVFNTAGRVRSQPVILSVGSVSDPAITIQPADVKVRWGEDIVFSVSTTGSGPLSYRWQIDRSYSGNWIDLTDDDATSGAGTAMLRIRQRGEVMQAYSFRCVVRGAESTIVSRSAMLLYDFSRPPGFDAESYLLRYPDAPAKYGDLRDRAWEHYLWGGWNMGYSDGTFDVVEYLAQNPAINSLLSGNLRAAVLHWYYVGWSTRQIPEGFDVYSYLVRHPEHQAKFASDLYGAWLYYRDVGVYDGEVYDDLFRPEEYLALYPELLAALGADLKKALVHWLAEGRIEGRLGRIPLEFDAAGYFERNPDVAAAVGNNLILGWQHFWNYGIYEGRAYDDEFRAFEYLALNEDLQAAFLSDWRGATLHWLRYGRIEGRLGRVPPIFDVDFYLMQYPDVEAVWGTYQSTVFLHYYFFGVFEARIFDNLFRVDEYIALNPDLQAVFGTDRRGAFMHWVRWGRSEGRPGRSP